MCRGEAFSVQARLSRGNVFYYMHPVGYSLMDARGGFMYQALYRAYRPEVFEDVLGQEHIVKILKNQIATDSVGHAYLFCGTRGTGKTTTARLLAKGLNCLSEGSRPCGTCAHCQAIKDGTFMDVIEIDAASNRNIDDVRELRETINYPPALGRKKVYIIDEVHMLTIQAANALLKTLEEPPEDVVFILCTTDPQKLPATILSRCIRFDFRRVSENVLTSGMDRICRDRGINVAEDALRLIASNADGSVRDGLSILDQCLSIGKESITREDVLDLIGISGYEVFLEMTDYISSGRTDEALVLLSNELAEGKDVRQFMKDWIAHYRSLLITKYVKNPENILNVSSENVMRIRAQAEKIDTAEIHEAILELANTMQDARYSTQARVLLELSIVKLSDRNFGKAFMRPAVQQPVQTAQTQATQAQAPVAQQAPANQIPVQMYSPVQEEPLSAAAMEAFGMDTSIKMTEEGIPVEVKPTPVKSQPEMQAQAAAPVEAAPTTGYSSADLERLWQRVFEEGEVTKSSFNLLRGYTTLVELTDRYFVVEAQSALRFNYLKQNSASLATIMEKLTGRRLEMKCYIAGERKPETDVEKLEETRAAIKELLGIDVKIK